MVASRSTFEGHDTKSRPDIGRKEENVRDMYEKGDVLDESQKQERRCGYWQVGERWGGNLQSPRAVRLHQNLASSMCAEYSPS